MSAYFSAYYCRPKSVLNIDDMNNELLIHKQSVFYIAYLWNVFCLELSSKSKQSDRWGTAQVWSISMQNVEFVDFIFVILRCAYGLVSAV